MADEQTSIPDTNENDGASSAPLVTGIAPKKRGRPPGSKGKGKVLDFNLETERVTVPISDSNSLESSQFIGEAFVSGLELVESFVHSSCAKKIGKTFPDKLPEFKEMAEKSGLQPKDRELAQKCAAKIAAKYDVLLKHAPEFVLAAFMVQYSLRQVALVRFVENVTKNIQPAEVVSPKA